jgi:hypothetical protein
MFETLRTIKAEHPFLKIVIGMDANHFIEGANLMDADGATQLFSIFPATEERPTTVKERTFLQAQFKKAGVRVSEVKDEIVTTNQILESHIEKANGEESLGESLPSDTHPYDHYIVRAVIKFL